MSDPAQDEKKWEMKLWHKIVIGFIVLAGLGLFMIHELRGTENMLNRR